MIFMDDQNFRGQECPKGVDVSLTTQMLSHAYRGNYDVAYLLAGDGDYAPHVEGVCRLGRMVIVVFFLTMA
jgi:uncharacterized LabA/DUF88 family protein